MRLHVISLGAGVQSTTMALMAAHGEIKPTPDAAIFADTGAEPKAVYEHLKWLRSWSVLPFPVWIVSAGNLKQQILAASEGKGRMDARPPFFTAKGGMLNRQCTHDFKVTPIVAKVRELIGIEKGRRGPRHPVVEQWIGISLDEASRMKPSKASYIEHRWPLIEKRMTRRDCLKWLEEQGYSAPPKSACTFCPFTGDGRWKDMKRNDPVSFAEAVEVDRAIRNVSGQRKAGGWFVHSSCRPLDQIDFSNGGQADLFNNECEGMCGV